MAAHFPIGKFAPGISDYSSALLVCHHLLLSKKDETVLLVGQGPMGTALSGAKLTAGKTIAVDFYENRLDKSLELGADVVINRTQYSADEVIKKVRDETNGRGADVVVMCISEDRSIDGDAYDMAIAAMRQRGRMTGLLVDVKNIGQNQRINPRQLLRKEARFCHTLNEVYHNTADELVVFQNAVDKVASGAIGLDKLITHEVGFAEVEKMLDSCANKLDEVVKVVVYPT